MKTISQLIKSSATLVIACLALTGCADFLEITPRDQVTEDNFWNEKADIDQMVAGCYASMQADAFIRRCIVWGELRSENIYPGSNAQNNEDIYQSLRENLLTTNSYADWSSFYIVINKCNTIIEKAPEVSQKDPSYRMSDVRATIAEMTALRSLCYFYLIRAFDAVPFTRQGVEQEDEVVAEPASSFNYILGEIIKDLESVKGDALEHYAAINDQDGIGLRFNSNCNRITRNAINAMLTDMYLWQGNYDKAIACAQEVLAAKRKDYDREYKSQTSLANSAPQLVEAPHGLIVPLYVNTQANPSVSANAIFGTGNSFESLFELSYNPNGIDDETYIHSSALGTLFGNNLPQNRGGNNGIGLLTVNPAFVADAPTRWKIFRNQYDVRYYNTIQSVDNNYGEGYIRKCVASEINLSDLSGSVPYNNYSQGSFRISATTQDRNWIFYRLTDVMLMEAEAYLMKATSEETEENTELLEKAFDLIYLVDRRSIVDRGRYLNESSAEAKSRGQLIERLRQERNAELMFEGKHWFDLVRYAKQAGSLDIIQSTVTAKLSGNVSFPSMAHLFWPYHKEECKKNPNLVQKSIYGEGKQTFELN